MTNFLLLNLSNIESPNFVMTPLELKDYIDFEVKRVYFITNPKADKLTGSHCHLKAEDELFIMMAGTCTAVIDDGTGLKEIKLSAPRHALRVPPMVWHHFKDLSDDCVLVALTSTNYDPSRADYCEDYEECKKMTHPKVDLK